MKSLDVLLTGIVFAVWGVLTILYATIPMIYMPASIRVRGSGAVLFLILAAVIAIAEARGGRRRPPVDGDAAT